LESKGNVEEQILQKVDEKLVFLSRSFPKFSELIRKCIFGERINFDLIEKRLNLVETRSADVNIDVG
jgi:hypothetical protein